MSPAADAATRTARRSTRFVSWVRAWRAGLVPFDELADEIAGDEEHLVADAPGTWTDVPLAHGLPVFAKVHPDDIRLVLPAPGDPRGLPGPGELTGAAMLAGEAVMTPDVRRGARGARGTPPAPGWSSRRCCGGSSRCSEYRPVFQIGAAEAEAELAAALGEATAQLTRLDVAQWKPELAGALQALRRPESTATLPPGFDPRARRLFARASVLDQVLALAETNAPGGARQRLRGAAARRGPAAADDRLPAGAGRGLQLAAACLMPDRFAHCTFCGARFTRGQAWPRRCGACGETSYRNPAPVAVAVQPVGEGLLVVRRGIPPARGRLALPGGFIDFGEAWQAAVVRELHEETGLRRTPPAVRHFETVSAPDGTLLIFGLLPRLAELPASGGESLETLGWEVLSGPAELGFSLHTAVAERFFATAG